MQRATLYRTTPLLFFILALAACGGSSSGNGGDDDSPDDTTDQEDDLAGEPDPDAPEREVETFLFAQGSLWAIDPDEPQNAQLVDDHARTTLDEVMLAGPMPVWGTGTWDDAASFPEQHLSKYVVYSDTSGQLWRVNTDIDGDPTTAPGRERMSSASGADVCAWSFVPDYRDPLDSLVAYGELPEEDACNSASASWYYTRLGADDSTPPTEYTAASGRPDLGRAYHGVDGALLGFLQLRDENLVRVDTDFEEQEVIKTDVEDLVGGAPLPNRPGMLILDDGPHVYEYRPDGDDRLDELDYSFQDATLAGTNAMVPTVRGRMGEYTSYFLDDGGLHLVDLESAETTLVHQPDDIGSDDGIPVPGATQSDYQYTAFLTDDYLVFLYPRDASGDGEPDTTRLVSFDRDTHEVVDSEDIGEIESSQSWLGGGIDNLVFYTRIVDDSAEAVIRHADGSQEQTFDDGVWLTAEHGVPVVRSPGAPPAAAIVIDDMTDPFFTDGPGGGTLRAVSGLDEAVELGTLDEDITSFSSVATNVRPMLAMAMREGADGELTSDLYLVDPRDDGDLVQIDPATDTDHRPVPMF